MNALRSIAALSLFVVLLGWPVVPTWGQNLAFPKSTAEIVGEGTRHTFQIELAITPAHHARGLMFREHLEPDAGMLFDFGVTAPVQMWMKNTLIPLDMLFVSDKGRITHIAKDTVPHSLKVISSNGPARGVLEVPAGTAKRLNIQVGDRLVHSLFGG